MGGSEDGEGGGEGSSWTRAGTVEESALRWEGRESERKREGGGDGEGGGGNDGDEVVVGEGRRWRRWC